AQAFFRANVGSLTGELVHQRFGLLQVPSVHARTCLVWCLAELGEFPEAIATGQEAVRLAEAMEHPLNIPVACSGLGVAYLRKGEIGDAISVLERGVEKSREGNVPLWFPRVASDLGMAYALAGRIDLALPLLLQAVEQGAAMELMAGHSLSVGSLGHGYLIARRAGGALGRGRPALRAGRGPPGRG